MILQKDTTALDTEPSTGKKSVLGIIILILKILGTILLIALVTAIIFIVFFSIYVNTTLRPQLDITFEDYALTQTSYLYYTDNDTGENKQWTDIMTTEQRTWVDYEDIPQYMIDAAVSIEDKRFFEHDGVDWYRTAGAVYKMFLGKGDDGFGASTLTQQLIKNLTDYDDVTVKRKIIEIFRALEVEKNYDKDEIITWYLNVIYLGENSYGVQAAAQTYFGKDAKDLSLAQCACIIGITNQPTTYNPYYSKENNKIRQETILEEMYGQGYITQDEYTQALDEELVFVRQENEEADSYIYSYYEETVITEAITALMEQTDLSEEAAKTRVYNGGLSIYTCIDMDVQDKLDCVYTDLDAIPATTGSNQQLQSAMTIEDPEMGKIVALSGGVGTKEINFGFNRATDATRPPGSSLKPLAVYGPALDTGTITINSTYQDSPITISGQSWPRNDSGVWSYSSYNIKTAVQKSINTIAVRVLQDLGLGVSYSYLKNNLGITTLEDSAEDGKPDINLAPLALGQLTNGVTVQEMTAAYGAIANGGTYIKAKTFNMIYESNGDVLLDNSEPDTSNAFSAQTTDVLTSLLYNAVVSGTGTTAKLSSGMAVAGKTGTTGDNYDRWFCGFTPYYVAACWTGYDTPESIKLSTGNPAAQIWNKVMTLIHEDLDVVKTFEPKSTDTASAAATGYSKVSPSAASPSYAPAQSPSPSETPSEEPSEEPSPSPSEEPSPSPSEEPSPPAVEEPLPSQAQPPPEEHQPSEEPDKHSDENSTQSSLPSEAPN